MVYHLSELNFNNKMAGFVYIIDDGGNEYEVPINKDSETLLLEGGAFAKAYLNERIGQYILIDDNFESEYLTNQKQMEFIIWHEVGHLVTTNWDDPRLQEDQFELRKKYVEEGKVLEYELFADHFAVEQVGKETAIEALDILIKFFNNNYSADSHLSICLKEFELRKQLIEKM